VATAAVEETVSPGQQALERARAALDQGNGAAAVQSFEAAFAADPALRANAAEDYARALTAEGRRLLEEGGPGATARFEAAIAAAPGLFEPHFMLGNAYTREGKIEQAMKEYERALRIEPDSADAHFNLGFLYVRQERFREAAAEYEKASKLDPPYPEDVFYNLSVCYERLGDREKARDAIERGLKRVPDSETLAARRNQLGD
jgi:Tfp pilus assembly protein PilF